MLHFTVRPQAWREINLELDYLEEQAGLEVADRLLDRLQDSFAMLAETPRIGARCTFRNPVLRHIRRWPVKDFERWLIFYLVVSDGVEIIHVLHGARDIEGLLDL